MTARCLFRGVSHLPTCSILSDHDLCVIYEEWKCLVKFSGSSLLFTTQRGT